jgi:hypothetical protein
MEALTSLVKKPFPQSILRLPPTSPTSTPSSEAASVEESYSNSRKSGYTADDLEKQHAIESCSIWSRDRTHVLDEGNQAQDRRRCTFPREEVPIQVPSKDGSRGFGN